MGFTVYSRGVVLHDTIGKSGPCWVIHEDGPVLYIMRPSSECENTRLGGHYDFCCTRIKSALFFSVKIQDGTWLDMSYSPHLSPPLKLQKYPKGTGMPLHILLVKSETGEIVDMDFMSLGNEFSNYIVDQYQNMLEDDFDKKKHNKNVADVYDKMSPIQLAESADIRFSID